MGPKIFLSGNVAKKDVFGEPEFLTRTGVKYRCFSYAYCGETGPFYKKDIAAALEYIKKSRKAEIMMDSGAHSFHNLLYKASAKGKLAKGLAAHERHANVSTAIKDFVGQYVSWVKKSNWGWDFFFTFDWEKRCSTIWDVTAQMRKAGLMPVPVYHGDDSLDWLRKYIDAGHDLIGLGVSRALLQGNRANLKMYYNRVFNLGAKHNVRFHGLAVTGDYMFMYPWYSVDSTSWLKLAAYGKILLYEPNRKKWKDVHLSDRFAEKVGKDSFMHMGDYSLRGFRDMIEAKGFDLDKLRSSMYERAIFNAYVFAHDIQTLPEKEPSKWTRLL